MGGGTIIYETIKSCSQSKFFLPSWTNSYQTCGQTQISSHSSEEIVQLKQEVLNYREDNERLSQQLQQQQHQPEKSQPQQEQEQPQLNNQQERHDYSEY